tara:strand:- start:1217 stop:2425 length:1209 start_codon:yes stop_codon:yes gene_type:complete
MTTTNEPNVVQDYENLNSAFDSLFPDYQPNENLLFNTELLNRCRQECKHKIDVQVLAYGGKMVTNVLELIDIRTVHPAGKEIKNNKTGKVLPKGFQIRFDTNIDIAHKDDILEDIWSRDWLPSAPQMVFFRLPKEYQYVGDDGVQVVWGIIDGAHRYDAADDANETSVIGWLVDMEIDKIRKFANAELNRVKYGAKARTNNDIAASVCISYKDETSDLYAKIQVAEEGDVNQILLDEIMTYHVKSQTAGAILRIIMHDPDVVVDRKEYDSKRMSNYIAEHKLDWTRTKDPHCDYVSGKGVRIIVTQASGSNHVIVAHDICQLLRVSNDPISVVFATAITDKLNKANSLEKRLAFKRKVIGVIKVMGEGYKAMFEDLTAVNPNWLCFPELADEFDDGLINITV